MELFSYKKIHLTTAHLGKVFKLCILKYCTEYDTGQIRSAPQDDYIGANIIIPETGQKHSEKKPQVRFATLTEKLRIIKTN